MKYIFTLFVAIALANADNFLHAQICSNETIQFRETFGSGDVNAPLPGGRTNYNYNETGPLADGDYRLNKSSLAKPEWHDAPDHTGDVNGRMMVTNASFSPGEFYRDTVYNLSLVETYSVYFHVMNVNTLGTCGSSAILPRLQLVVESYNNDGTFTQLGVVVSNDIPQTSTPTWVKISGFFNLPSGVTALRYRIINNSTGGCGNDLAIDDITFSQCAQLLLPVTGMSLKAHSDGASVQLSWSTFQERNTDKFIIEKSHDGKSWKFLTSVSASGESHSRKDYEARDDHSAGVCYYRVKAADLDGGSTYSNSVIIRSNAKTTSASVYPNPFISSLGVEVSVETNKQSVLRMFNVSGKMIKMIAWSLKAGTNVMNVSSLENVGNGLYFLDVVDNSGRILYKTKLLKK